MPKQNRPPLRGASDASMRVDLRIPFALCAAEGLLLLSVYTLLVFLKSPRLTLTGLCFAGVYALSAGITFLAYSLRVSRARAAERAAELLNTDVYRMFRSVVDVPYAVVNGDGSIRIINAAMQDILGFRSPVCNIPFRDVCPGVTPDLLADAAQNPDGGPMPSSIPAPMTAGSQSRIADGTALTVRLADGRRYLVEPYLLRQHDDHYYFVMFRDVNDYLELCDKWNRERVVVAYIELDNLQELTQFVGANYRATAGRIEEILTEWIASMNGMMLEYHRDKFLALFNEEALDGCIREGFPILDRVMHTSVGDNTFPLSISIGVADIDGSMGERERAAREALDTAMQRGGNQVALRRRGATGLSFFGGAHKILEGNTSISSRVSVHLLEKRLSDCDAVFIMGHSNPDFDAIGSSVGAARLCRSILSAQGRGDVPVRVVVNKACETYRICEKHLENQEGFKEDELFIDKSAAGTRITPHTVLILTDVNNPVIFEAPELIRRLPADASGAVPVAVIDHHRLVGQLPFVPFLHYIEATKSSASEIVAEMLEQSAYADTLTKEEANLLLAGIMLDTHNFTRSAGAQTFSMIYYLYSRNAHTETAREFFNENMEELKVAGDFDAHTQLYEDVFAITWLSEEHVPRPEDRIAASKAADKLLSLQGVEASFALAVVGRSVAISGRSKGRINVQLILEKLDGGGHFDMAGAQVAGGVDEAVELLLDAINDYRKQYPELCKKAE